MRRRALFALAILAAAGASGCSEASEQVERPSFEDTCPRGLTRPVSVHSLIRIARQNGVSLQRDPECTLHAADVDAASNVVDAYGDEYEDIVRREGHVTCHVADDPTRRGIGDVTRTKYPTDEETYFDVANVNCAIYPETPAQVDRLERALEAVARGPVNRRRCPQGVPAPITVEEVIARAREHKIELKRDHRCIEPDVVAQVSNIVPYENVPNADQIGYEQGEITCLLRRRPHAPSDRIAEEKATVTTRFSYRNVACTVSPLPDTNERHVAQLRAVFDDLRRRD